ncbi:MAG TPA: flagellar protein FlaG [Spirochaetota bacterium]
MDVSLYLSQTINSLSQSPQSNDFHAGEIAIIEEARSGDKGEKEVSQEDVDRMMRMLERAADTVDNRLSFEYNSKTKRLIMRVTDPDTNEVVRQVPSREMIRLLENIHDMIGMFIDDKR